MKQEIGTRIFYGEEAIGPGQEFHKIEDFEEYLRHTICCLQQENVDTKAADFEHYLIMSRKSEVNLQADFKSWSRHSGFIHGFFISIDGVKFKTTVRDV